MSLRVAFDLDGVLADMDGSLRQRAASLFQARLDTQEGDLQPPRSGEHDNSRGQRLTSAQLRRLWRHVKAVEDFWETLDEHEPGVVARLDSLAAARRWEIIFLTKRPETVGRLPQVQSQRWLQSKGFTLPSVFVVHGSRGRVAAALALDFVIDDRPENCLDVVADSKARAVLVWRKNGPPPPAVQSLGIGVVSSVEQCLDALQKVETVRRRRILDRVLEALGLDVNR